MRSEKLPSRVRNLIVIELHGTDGAAAELVVVRVRAERPNYSRMRARVPLGVSVNVAGGGVLRSRRFYFRSSSVLPQCPLV